MGTASPNWWTRAARGLVGLVAPCLVPLAVAAADPEPLAAPQPAPAVAAPQVQVLSLQDSLRLALEKQPTLAAHRASLAAAQTQRRALEHLLIPSLLKRELPIRRRQAALGVCIAEAGLHQAEWETVYAVTRTYFAVLYARSQETVARDAVDKLKQAQKQALELLKAASPDYVVTKGDVDKLGVFVDLGTLKQVEAATGSRRALAALREAIGLGPECCIQVPEGQLPYQPRQLCLSEALGLALARRGELVQAANASEATALEVEAQGATLALTARTFAAVSDIHARQIPQGESNGEYRPGAVGLDMPTTLAGCRSARVERARDLSARAQAVVEKTRNLIALEVEDLYLKWEEASRKVQQLQKSPAIAAQLAENLQERFGISGKVPAGDLVQARVLASQAQAAYNEAVWQHALALAALERATAGGIAAGFGAACANQP